MFQTSEVNRRIVLAARPEGAPTPDDFRVEREPVPQPDDGQLLLPTVFLSLDPYIRGRMSDAASYADPVEIGGVMVGATVCRVAVSHHPGYSVGEWVLAQVGWQDHAVSDGTRLRKLDPAKMKPSQALGVLGMPGFTAYMGLTDIGQPKAGETVAVAAASGAVGSVVGPVAKLLGCRAVGIAGGGEKCDHVVEELGFDACIDHHEDDMAERRSAPRATLGGWRRWPTTSPTTSCRTCPCTSGCFPYPSASASISTTTLASPAPSCGSSCAPS